MITKKSKQKTFHKIIVNISSIVGIIGAVYLCVDFLDESVLASTNLESIQAKQAITEARINVANDSDSIAFMVELDNYKKDSDSYTEIDGEVEEAIVNSHEVQERPNRSMSSGVSSKAIKYIKPIQGGITTSKYGARWGTVHLGHDWGVPVGTKVMSSADGKVKEAGWNDSYGYYVLVEHGEDKQTRYAHLSSIFVEVGDKVKQEHIIGLTGNTGNSTGPHLHFEVIIDGDTVDPVEFLEE